MMENKMTRMLVVAFLSLATGIGLGLIAAPATDTPPLPSFNSASANASAISRSFDEEKQIHSNEALVNQPVKLQSAEVLSSGFYLIKQALNAAENMSNNELFSYISGLRQMDVSSVRKHSLASIYIERLVALDPELAIAAVRGNKILTFTWLSYFGSWANQNLSEAMTYYQSLSAFDDKQKAAQVLLGLEGIEESGYLPILLAELGSKGQRALLQAKLSRLPAEAAFEEALALIESGSGNRSLILELVLRWSSEDLPSALARLSTLEEGAMRDQLLEMAINNTAATNGEELLELVTRYASGNKRVMNRVIAKIAKEDPMAALPLAEEIAKNSGNLDVLRGVLGAWGERDIKAAFTYVEGLSTDQQKTLYHSLAYTYAKESPRDAALWALTLGEELDLVSSNTLSTISREQPKLLEDMLSTLSKPADQKKLREVIWTSKGQTNPSKAIEDYLADGNNTTSDDIFSSLMTYWYHDNPVDAAEYISLAVLENPEIKNGASGVRQWYRADPEAATNWVDSLPSGSRPQRDGLNNLVRLITEDSPSEAAQYVLKMPEGKQRTSAANRVAHTWLKKDPETFDQMVGALHLSEEAVAHMRKHQSGELD